MRFPSPQSLYCILCKSSAKQRRKQHLPLLHHCFHDELKQKCATISTIHCTSCYIQFCIKNNDLNLSDPSKKAHLFITILLKILHSKIKFVRTKQQPLLPNQSLMQPNKFKTTFIKFIENFNLKCNAENISNLQTVQIYHKDKKRSLKILALFVKSLVEIEKMLLSPHNYNYQNQTNPLQSNCNSNIKDEDDQDVSMKQKESLNLGLVSPQRAQQQPRPLHFKQALFPSHPQQHIINDTPSLSSSSMSSSVSPCTSVNDQNLSTNPLSISTSSTPSTPTPTQSLMVPQIPRKSPFIGHGHIKQPSAYHNNLNNTKTNLPISTLSTAINMNQGRNTSNPPKIHKFNPYSIYVPLHRNYTLKYQFLSFNPLRVKKIMIISKRSSV